MVDDKVKTLAELSPKDAIEFYEPLVENIRKLYGTDDPKELERIAKQSEDLWLEEHISDLEIYHALKQEKKGH